MRFNAKSAEKAYEQRQKLIIIGLTGRTGSGCSTCAKILSTEKFGQLSLRSPKRAGYDSKEERKYDIIYKFMEYGDHWSPFVTIEGSSIIFSYILERPYREFVDYLKGYKNIGESNEIRISAFDDLMKKISEMEYMFDSASKFRLSIGAQIPDEDISDFYDFYTNKLSKYKNDFRNMISDYTCHKDSLGKDGQIIYSKYHLYTFLMQEIGNNIRSSGNPFSGKYSENNYYDVAERIDKIIEIIKRYNNKQGKQYTRICIDAIRNPYEAYYFKDRYKSFYLISINCDDKDRQTRLPYLDSDEKRGLDEIEYGLNSSNDYDLFFHQNIQECLSISDIHIYNPQINYNKYFYLSEQLLKYVSLMLHPGLVPPTHVERCMQTAYVARLNSGCLSRQVGAAITDEDFSVKAIGWNEVPEGQVPCNLRCAEDYCQNRDIESFSSYELEDKKFQDAIVGIKTQIEDKKDELCGLSFPFCFKDIYNGITDTKNQVYTRALHAEENAFLQLSKYGGEGIKGGKLFCTASPCELCAKKAYQLGIKDIFYIDSYPGISVQHILKFGSRHNPRMNLYCGAIGDAYIRLYLPRIPIKDELKLRTGLNVKKVARLPNKELELSEYGIKDVKYTQQKYSFIFNSRSDIVLIEESEMTALIEGITSIPHKLYWSGSSFDGFQMTGCSRPGRLEVFSEANDPYSCRIILEDSLPEGESVEYGIKTSVKDTNYIMSPYFAHIVKEQIEMLEIVVEAPVGLLNNAEKVVYAANDMIKEWELLREPIQVEHKEGREVFSIIIKDPNINYTYCIEWAFSQQGQMQQPKG